MAKLSFTPKPIKQQTIVITGASSGIGLATAKMAANRGANVVMVARSEEALEKCAAEILRTGGKALAIVADMSKAEDISRVKDETLRRFNQINTWINNAGVSIYGYLMDASLEDERQLFETNFWGARIASQLAVEAMQKEGGTLINIGSEVSVAAQPFLGMYSASKHALKAFTDALRSELRDQKIPVAVCLVRPTAINTPFPVHAANKLREGEPSLPEPLYDPDVAAAAILKCAENPQRDIYVGGPARLSAILDTFFPEIKDIVSETRMKDLRKGTTQKHLSRDETLHKPPESAGEVRGPNDGKVFHSSLYTSLTSGNFIRSVENNVKSAFKRINRHQPRKEA